MPWRCPACRTEIRHHDGDDRPRQRVLYRCHVCRLELVLHPQADRLTVAPITREEAKQKVRTVR